MSKKKPLPKDHIILAGERKTRAELVRITATGTHVVRLLEDDLPGKYYLAGDTVHVGPGEFFREEEEAMQADDQNQTCETPRSDLARQAAEHYEEISLKACHWNPIIPEAIKAWEREPELIDTLREASKVLGYFYGVNDNARAQAKAVEVFQRLQTVIIKIEGPSAGIPTVGDLNQMRKEGEER